jgi:hypothetical protein
LAKNLNLNLYISSDLLISGNGILHNIYPNDIFWLAKLRVSICYFFLKNLGKPTGCSSPALRGSGQAIATVVAHREPWGVEKINRINGFEYITKITTKKFLKNWIS